MERLTIKIPEKEKDVIDKYLGRNYFARENVGNTEIDNKLGAIEDLEEEIGLPLEFILTKVIGKDYFYIDDGFVSFETATALGHEYNPYKNEVGEWTIETNCCGVLKPSEYKKTWWLSEEEAEKALEGIKNGKKE